MTQSTDDSSEPASLGIRLAARYQRILREGAWVIVGQAGGALAAVVGTRILTIYVPPDVFGYVALLLGIATFVKNVTCMPLAHAGMRFYAESALAGQAGLLRRILSRGLLYTWLTAALGLMAGIVYAATGHGSPWAYVLLATFFLVDVLRTMETTYLAADRRQRALSLWTVMDSWLKPLLAIAAVLWLGASPAVVLLGYTLASVIPLTAYLAMDRRVRRKEDAVDGHEKTWDQSRLISEIRRFALPLIPLAVVLWVNAISDRYIIEWISGPKAVGIYVATYALVSMPFLNCQMILTQTLRPVYLQALAAGNRRQAYQTYSTWVLLGTAINALGFILFMVLKGWVAFFLLAPKYRDGVVYVPWLAAGYAIYTSSQMAASYLQAHKRTAAWLAGEAAGAIVSVPVTILLVKNYGPLGAAMACPIYCMVILVVMAGFALSTAAAPRQDAAKAQP